MNISLEFIGGLALGTISSFVVFIYFAMKDWLVTEKVLRMMQMTSDINSRMIDLFMGNMVEIKVVKEED